MIAKDTQPIPRPEENQDRGIFISGRIEWDLYPKVNPARFLKILRKKIDLTQYGDGIAEFYFTFVLLETITPNFSGWVGSDYYPKQASIDIGIRVPYQEVVAGDEKAVMELMEAALLEGIDTIGKHEPELVAPFDYRAFKADVEAIFADPDWYVEASTDPPKGEEEE